MIVLFAVGFGLAQAPTKAELGSRTAKNGFRNETEIAGKFNNWRTDGDARQWLATMNYNPVAIENVSAVKPHGEKADILVRVTTDKGTVVEGISIKLVSTSNGFNQIDKRWVSEYARIWKMPPDVAAALKLFVGENGPVAPARVKGRMFLNELDSESRTKIIRFFSENKAEIVSDLLAGDGHFRARWMLVALKSAEKPRWVLRRIEDVAKFFSEGDVVVTRGGNLRMGRITMQRKGGDGGRETAKMLQFKINPALLFESAK